MTLITEQAVCIETPHIPWKSRKNSESVEEALTLRTFAEHGVEIRSITKSDKGGNPHIVKSDNAYCLPTNPDSDSRPMIEIANTVTPDAYLARGERNRDENGKAVLTSMHERRIRRLTPTECARLQGFPDDWHEGVSDTQAYKCYGNAVSVPVVEAVAERLLKEVQKDETQGQPFMCRL